MTPGLDNGIREFRPQRATLRTQSRWDREGPPQGEGKVTPEVWGRRLGPSLWRECGISGLAKTKLTFWAWTV